jgi:hypothetical protein
MRNEAHAGSVGRTIPSRLINSTHSSVFLPVGRDTTSGRPAAE